MLPPLMLAGLPGPRPVLMFLEGEKAALFERSGYVDDGRARCETLNHTQTHNHTYTHARFKRSHESGIAPIMNYRAGR